jgi:hypothetical protein
VSSELRVAEDPPVREREVHGRRARRRRGYHGGCYRFRDHGGTRPRSPAQVLPRRGTPVAADLAETDTVFPGTEAAQDEAEHVGGEITPAARHALLPELKKKIHQHGYTTIIDQVVYCSCLILT